MTDQNRQPLYCNRWCGSRIDRVARNRCRRDDWEHEMPSLSLDTQVGFWRKLMETGSVQSRFQKSETIIFKLR